MQDFLYFLFEKKIYITYIMELLAALAGSFYLFYSKPKNKNNRMFVIFLWSVLIIDILGGYTGLAYFNDYEYFAFIEGTPFERNTWYYNVAEVYFICFYTNLFRKQLSGIKKRFLLKWLIISYLIFAILNMVLSGEFFNGDLIINDIVGAFMIVTSVFLYFFDMMISDKVLNFYKDLFFFVAVGVSISYLSIIPINIYDSFISYQNEELLELFYTVMRYSNIFMYSMFVLGFYFDYRYKQKEMMFLETTNS